MKFFMARFGWKYSIHRKKMKFLNRFIFIFFCSFLNLAQASNSGIHENSVSDYVVGQKPPINGISRIISRNWESDENGDKYEIILSRVHGMDFISEVHDGLIWRISVKKKGLRTLAGIGVGDSVRSLLRKNSKLIPYIGPGPTLFLIAEKSCGISYMTDIQIPESLQETLVRDFASRLSGNERITEITVTGCSN